MSYNVWNDCTEKLQILLFMGGCMENLVIKFISVFFQYFEDILKIPVYTNNRDHFSHYYRGIRCSYRYFPIYNQPNSVSFRKPKLCDSILQKDEKLKENPNILFKTV